MNGIKIKIMLDALHINHVKKTIQPIDIKTGVLDSPAGEDFFQGPYLTYNYYIQAGLYRKVVEEFFRYQEKYQDYTVTDFTFVYSTTNPKTSHKVENVFIHKVCQDKHMESFKGFPLQTYDEKGMTTIYGAKQGIAELFKFYKENLIVEKQDQ